MTQHLIAVLVLAESTVPAPATSAALGFRATLHAQTHRPLAAQPWRYVVRVTDAMGRAIRARARFRIAFDGPSAPRPLALGSSTFRGRHTATYRWPRRLRDEPLVFEAVVTARGATRTLRYWIRVR